jgi:UDP-N-acetylmuramoyl-tripeptide--D-alanyl-D-alanine ligase
MSALWTFAEAAAAVGGRASDSWTASGVSIDSRTVAKGDLFVALKGPNFDGHDYVAAAIKAGAVAAMVERRPADAETAPILLVDDCERGLVELGRTGRARSNARVVAVTGSVGKTGVKEALAHLLGKQGEAYATAGNLNNQYGVPLSLARLPQSAAYAVLEIGMNHAGEITPLTRLVRPHVAIVTTVAPVHMEFFSSVEAIAEAKAEIFLGVEQGGTAVINRDNPQYELLADRAKEAGVANIVGFGADKRAAFRLTDLKLDVEGSRIEAQFAGGTLTYRLNLPGRHWATNSLAVLAAVHALGADVFAAAAAFAEIVPPKGRGARHTVNTGGIEFLLIDDSYNASPVSMAAALRVLAQVAPQRAGRRIAVLGDMLELGPRSDDFHRNLVHEVHAAGIDLIFAAGERMRLMFEALPPERRGARAGTAAELSPLVCQALRDGDVVLVKGSAGSRTGLIVRDLLALDRG